ncbi:MAG: hypothetical protein ABIM89_18630, partial [Mycobacteriales bacterium]
MPTGSVTLRVALSQSSLDARRGVVRVHYQLLANLGARAWDVLQLTGERATGAIAAFSAPGAPVDVIYADDLTMSNCGVRAGDSVDVQLVTPAAATRISLSAPVSLNGEPDDVSLRFALLGKVVSLGDRVGLLPQDFTGSSLPPATHLNVLGKLAGTFGADWQQDLLVVTAVEPTGRLARVTMATTLECTGSAPSIETPSWSVTPSPAQARPNPAAKQFPGLDHEPAARASSPSAPSAPATPATPPPPPPSVEDLPGLENQIAALREWLDLGFHRGALLASLGARPTMGVLVTGPAGSGKRALVEAAAASVGA